MKKIFTAIASLAFLFLGTTVHAQQDPQFTMNMFNRLYANPGYAGSNNGICTGNLSAVYGLMEGVDGSLTPAG